MMPHYPTTRSELEDMILVHEGPQFTNHPADRGGPTKWGITQKVLSYWLGRPATIDEVRNLTRETAANIYYANYIRPFDGVADPLRCNVIDMGVNAGVVRAIRLMQQTVGTGVDGRIGPMTREATGKRDWNPLFVGVRIAFYESIIERDVSQLVWRNGWRNRALHFTDPGRVLALAMVGHPTGRTGKAYWA